MNFNPKHQVKVGGKMSQEAADNVGKTLANSAKAIAYALAFSIFSYGAALLIAALK
jgi:hypothetical protein